MNAMTKLLSWMKKRSSASKELARKAEAELAALREAGEKMAERLRKMNKKATLDATLQKNLEALAAWEAANK